MGKNKMIAKSCPECKMQSPKKRSLSRSIDEEYKKEKSESGSAGVTAATTLARAGRRVLGLEAQDRVGGRVYTVPFGNGLVELGAECRTYDLANEYNIALLPTPLNHKIFRSNGEEANATLVRELFDFCLAVVQEHPPDPPEPVGNFTMRKAMEYITEKYPELLKDQDFIDQFFELANLYVDGYESSNDWNEVTTDSQYEELKGNQVISWHRYGYKTFFEIMLNKYNGAPGLPSLEVKLGTEVTQIIAPQHPNEKVVVKCKDGSSYEADNVIVTVSIGVLKEKHTTLFSPPLPKNKQTAIEKISIGVIDKVILAFDRVWWPNNYSFFGFLWKGEDTRKVSQDDRWILNISGASPPMAASNVLTMWINGNAARKVSRNN
ncbi:hypothetical protein MSG28_015941 [Choristoneura fumiferana]|uniref:Uncharacterized protein n=1 Tax=Choristoneura fumiferana TaxID=7141 RepID=A0ACC0K4R6_CHOFU|nr:hypothetical protein MSG28_015941 [Choristoneura fumiferana]